MRKKQKECRTCEELQADILETARQLELATNEVSQLKEMVGRCEMWLSTHPEGRKMQMECQRILSKPNDQCPPTQTR